MQKFFIIYSILIILLFISASRVGWTVADSFSTGKWGPSGRSAYHK